MTIKEGIDKLQKQQETIHALLELGKIAKNKNGDIKLGEFKISTIYDDGASVIIATAEKKGDYFPIHLHEGAVQYLMCIKGKFIIDFIEENRHRYLEEKEMVSIPPDTKHRVTAIEESSKLIGVCIPIDKSYILGK